MPGNELANDIADRIKALSSSKGVSVRQALAECKTNLNFVNNLASRGSIPAADSFLPIADYFGVSLDWLLGRETGAASKDPECGKILDIMRKTCEKLGISDEILEDNECKFFSEYIDSHMEAYLRLKDKRGIAEKG
jgi:transcriptional regulator with XRE-family HTH domain